MLFYIVLCIVSSFVLFPISAQVYRPFPPDGNPTKVKNIILYTSKYYHIK